MLHLNATDRTLVIMAKAPRPGMVKTRLAQSLPAEAVTELYRCLLQDTVAMAQSLPGVNVAIMCPASDLKELEEFAGDETSVVAQQGYGLAAALRSVFEGFALPVVGPTHDGGYYLVGAKAAHAALFDGDGMGTTGALDALLARARKLQLSVGFTVPFYDIDVEEDLTRLAAELELAPARAPRTAGWLKQWKQLVAQLRTAAGGL